MGVGAWKIFEETELQLPPLPLTGHRSCSPHTLSLGEVVIETRGAANFSEPKINSYSIETIIEPQITAKRVSFVGRISTDRPIRMYNFNSPVNKSTFAVIRVTGGREGEETDQSVEWKSRTAGVTDRFTAVKRDQNRGFIGHEESRTIHPLSGTRSPDPVRSLAREPT